MAPPGRAKGYRMKAPMKKRARATRSAQDTKDAVLKAAIDEFAEHSLAGARVDRIAQRAGVNKQALYYHFGDKEGLFEAALVFGYTRFTMRDIDWSNDPRSATELMAQIAGSLFDLVHENRNHIALIADENRNQGKHLTVAVASHVRAATASTVEAINVVLRRGQEAGEFSQSIDPIWLYLELVGQPIFYFNHSSTLSSILQENTLSPEIVLKRRTQFVEFTLSALRNSGPHNSTN
jgi:TetR/AcrR family transcriptional regulator